MRSVNQEEAEFEPGRDAKETAGRRLSTRILT